MNNEETIKLKHVLNNHTEALADSIEEALIWMECLDYAPNICFSKSILISDNVAVDIEISFSGKVKTDA